MIDSKLLKKLKHAKETNILTKRGRREKIVFGVVFMIFTVYALSLFMPLLYLLINSLKTRLGYLDDVAAERTLALPSIFIFKNYLDAFVAMDVKNSLGKPVYLYMMFLNGIYYSISGTFMTLVSSTLTAYCMAKYRFKIRKVIYAMVIFSLTIPIMGTGGAYFKLVYDLNLYNTPLFTIIVGFGGFGFTFMIMFGFFKNLSWNYAEAVFIDGGGHFTAFIKIMVPQAFPVMMALLITGFIGSWNDYTSPLLYLPDYPTVASGIYGIEKSFLRKGNTPLYYAGLIIALIPILVVFTVFSDIIMKNFSLGGLKG